MAKKQCAWAMSGGGLKPALHGSRAFTFDVCSVCIPVNSFELIAKLPLDSQERFQAFVVRTRGLQRLSGNKARANSPGTVSTTFKGLPMKPETKCRGILFGCFGRKIGGDSCCTWWCAQDHLPGKSIYFPKRTPMFTCSTLRCKARLLPPALRRALRKARQCACCPATTMTPRFLPGHSYQTA